MPSRQCRAAWRISYCQKVGAKHKKRPLTLARISGLTILSRGDSNDSMACIILQKDERRIPTIIILPQSYTILMEKL